MSGNVSSLKSPNQFNEFNDQKKKGKKEKKGLSNIVQVFCLIGDRRAKISFEIRF